MKVKNLWLFIALLSLLGISSIIGCAQQTVRVPEQAINEIYAITSSGVVSQYAQVRNVEDKGDYCYVSINIIYDPEIIVSLEDAFIQAEIYTDAIAHNIVEILQKYDTKKDISVWAQLPLGEGEVALLGNTRYNAETKSYQFRRYKGD